MCIRDRLGDLQVEPFDPQRDGLAAKVVALDWPSPQVLRLHLQPARPLRYRPGQHLLLWSEQGVARPYSLAVSYTHLDVYKRQGA